MLGFANKLALCLILSFFSFLHSAMSDDAVPNGAVDSPVVYEGPVVDGKKEGVGIVYSDNGKVLYHGGFKNDKMSGRGKLFFEDGRVYTGFFVDGKMRGNGQMEYKDGRKYVGSFVDGVISGHGIFSYPNGLRYEGEWKNGLMDGYGIMKYNDGIYEGYWKDGSKNGPGKIRFHDGTRCEGSFVDGLMQGYGECFYANGNVYKGEWDKDKENGKGFMRLSTGDVYVGIWRDGHLIDGEFIEYSKESGTRKFHAVRVIKNKKGGETPSEEDVSIPVDAEGDKIKPVVAPSSSDSVQDRDKEFLRLATEGNNGSV